MIMTAHYDIQCKSCVFETLCPQLAPFPEYYPIDGVENIERYAPGGYHPVNLGDVLHERYRIVNKLGHGAYSTVWLALDTQQEQYVALKVCVANSLPNETRVLKDLSASSQVFKPKFPCLHSFPKILDEFIVDGPVARLHSRGYVHGGFVGYIHLYNVLAALPASFDNLSIEEFHKQYGEPDVLEISRLDGKDFPPTHTSSLTSRCSFSADIWSLAVAIWDIVGVQPVITSCVLDPQDTIAQYAELFWVPCRRHEVQARKDGMGEFGKDETAAILELMRRMLTFRPEDRHDC
ncbi:kinase-like domain-containing protein [Coprinopsis sp. MPI-PUGE-AT-0042]|nr:kinase-like domain-containing protein [Coprinopsis sp. MPI-PUGE-AT-0042]